MICTQLEVLLQESVAVQVRVMMAAGPGVAEHVPVCMSVWLIVGFGSQLSVAVADPVTAGSVELPHATVTFGGHVMIGGVVSFTVISCVQSA